MLPSPVRTGFALLACLGLAACATPGPRDARDPLEGMNRAVYRVNDAIDRHAAEPAARVYRAVTPGFLRTGLRNFFQNLALPIDIANDLLQAKPGQAARDTGRLVMNTVIGLGGFLDVASHHGMPDPDEDFGQTLGRWGMPAGPYLMLPLVGPSTLRDGLGEYGMDNNYFDPTRDHTPESERFNAKFLELLQKRTDLLGSEALLRESFDPYSFMRDAYLQRRAFLVHDGVLPVADDDPYADPGADPYADPAAEPPPDSDEGQHSVDI